MWKRIAIFGLVCVVSIGALTLAAQNFTDVMPKPQQVAWQDLEIGVLVHFGPNTFMNREWGDGTADPKVFNPAQFNPEQWVRAAKTAGANYLVFVAKHHDGFDLWPSGQTDYGVKSSPWRGGRGDVVNDLAYATWLNGMKFGLYLSPWDRHEPFYKDNKQYDDFYVKQLVELATRYGELTEFWLDGAGSEGHVYDFDRYVEQLRVYQPNALIFADAALLKYGDIRWVGNESGVATEENWNVLDLHGYLRWRPAEADTPLRKDHWFWHPNDEKSVKTVAELLDTYEKTVGRGAQLMIGIAPDDRGLLPDSDVARLAEFGAAVRAIYGPDKNLAGRAKVSPAFAAAVDGDPETFWRAPADSRSATIELPFDAPITFDRSITMEWLNDGQHIERYTIEALVDNKWITLHTGTSIGHKKIDKFPRTTATRVRLVILSSAGPISIREFQLFDGAAAEAEIKKN
ncbi:MAG TPA: alpha-L-fucosidase [Candidatus Acidoferrales bacterium]|nr:alpha-L-fucosidase [Candidatus Acidoferrales bacterium]